MKQKVIAIDGPAGAGKSTVARLVAEKLGFVYIDTGAMYRAVTCQVLAENLALDDQAAISALAGKIDVKLTRDEAGLHVWLDGREVTTEIRTPAVTAAVPHVSQIGAVRAAMVRLQRKMAATGAVVIDGLGPVKGGPNHTENERSNVQSVVPRLYLLTRLFMELGRQKKQ